MEGLFCVFRFKVYLGGDSRTADGELSFSLYNPYCFEVRGGGIDFTVSHVMVKTIQRLVGVKRGDFATACLQ